MAEIFKADYLTSADQVILDWFNIPFLKETKTVSLSLLPWDLAKMTPFGACCLVFNGLHCCPSPVFSMRKAVLWYFLVIGYFLVISWLFQEGRINYLIEESWGGSGLCSWVHFPFSQRAHPHCMFLQVRPSHNRIVFLFLGLSEPTGLILSFKIQKNQNCSYIFKICPQI